MVRFAAAIAAYFVFAASSASAAVVYQNPYNATNASGNCFFSSTCGTYFGNPNYYGAQSFTLSATTTIQSAAFTELTYAGNSTAVDWQILNSSFGTPTGVIASGLGSPLSATVLGQVGNYTAVQEAFNVGSITLDAGTYFLAVHAIAPVYTYLSEGTQGSGAAESTNGINWSLGYRGLNSVAISLNSDSITAAVPEPSTWAMMMLGFAGVGYMTYRKRNTASKAIAA